jgi:hypothetical protein
LQELIAQQQEKIVELTAQQEAQRVAFEAAQKQMAEMMTIMQNIGQASGLLQPVLPAKANLRCSLYADDAALFAHPSPVEMDRLQKILLLFGECSELKVNMNKTEIFPIRLQPEMVNNIVRNLPGKISTFPGNT